MSGGKTSKNAVVNKITFDQMILNFECKLMTQIDYLYLKITMAAILGFAAQHFGGPLKMLWLGDVFLFPIPIPVNVIA